MSNGFLSQEEIDALVKGDGGSTVKKSIKVLNDIEQDLLGEVGNISMGSASTALYQIINHKVNITTPVVGLTNLGDIKKSFETPTVVLDVEYTSGIVGRNILIIKIEDAAVIANLMMGGDGNVDAHDLSEIEISAVQEAMNQMIGSAATAMATMFSREVNISPPISKMWRDKGEVLTDTIPEDETIVRVSFKLTIGNLVDSNIMQILTIDTAKKIVGIMTGEEAAIIKDDVLDTASEELVAKEIALESKLEREVPQSRVREEGVQVHKADFEPLNGSVERNTSTKNIDLILDVPLDISVVLGRTKKSVKDILNLSTGSLIELDKLAEEPVEVLVNGKIIAHGEVVVVDENFGVRITSVVSNRERIQSLR